MEMLLVYVYLAFCRFSVCLSSEGNLMSKINLTIWKVLVGWDFSHETDISVFLCVLCVFAVFPSKTRFNVFYSWGQRFLYIYAPK